MITAKEASEQHVALRSKVHQALCAQLTDDWVELLHTDDAGNDIEEVSLQGVRGDGGMTEYPLNELTLGDMISILYTIENED